MTSTVPPSPIVLSEDDEERAITLHRDSVVVVVHDHCFGLEDLERMRAGGVTAKQLHLSVDARLWGSPELFRATVATGSTSAVAATDPDHADGFLPSALVALDHVRELVAASGGSIAIALEPEDITAAKARGGIALLLGSEGARMTGYRVEVLRAWADLGLRHLQLSWAIDHPLGTDQRDTSGRGLSPLGRTFVQELNRLGLIVDVSHLSYASIRDAVEESALPVLNGHSGASALNDTQPQLMPDDVIRAMARRGGVIAVHFMSQMVKPGRSKATFDHLMAQFVYLADLVGPEHLACGPDYLPEPARVAATQGLQEGFTYAAGVEDISAMWNVTRGLVSRGFSDHEIRGMLGGNVMRLFGEVRAARGARPTLVTPDRPALRDRTAGLAST